MRDIAEADRAPELDPLSLPASTLKGFILTNARRYDEAIEQNELLELNKKHFGNFIYSHCGTPNGPVSVRMRLRFGGNHVKLDASKPAG